MLPKNIDDDSPIGQSFKQIYGSLKGLINPIAAIRNAYGTGHGKDIHFQALDSRHAKLFVGISCTVTEFLWKTHKNADITMNSSLNSWLASFAGQ